MIVARTASDKTATNPRKIATRPRSLGMG